jgi:asparagine synthase (glutamine-hydrolysing)
MGLRPGGSLRQRLRQALESVRLGGLVCGICGKLDFDPGATVERSLVLSMLSTIRHRGPDDEGTYCAPQVGLGHRRLSIIDLTTGHQPLSNEDGSVWIVLNGEIYNYRELRPALEAQGHVFRTQTDTEVIVHLYEQYGRACVDKLRGMFAFAIWNARERELFLARDRVGIKPLYYTVTNHSLVFGSEIKALLADPELTPEVDPAMIDRFLSFYFVPGEATLFRGIRRLGPGHYLVARDGKVVTHQYWDLEFSESDISLQEAESRFLELLDETVRLHMISDVPVGVLLSGGVDSTAILRYAVGKTPYPLSSYTLGFSEAVEADERPYAKLAADRCGSQHHEMTISAQDFASFMPKYVWHMEEPVCEPQAVALYYVSRMARDDVKVLLSGEGGDEAFAGYALYRNLLWLERLKTALGPFKGLARRAMAAGHYLGSRRVAKYAQLLDIPLESCYYSRTSSPFRFFNSSTKDLYAADFLEHVNKGFSVEMVKDCFEKAEGASVVNRLLYCDTKTSLPDDLLVKADKMTMANSLELRVPFLDHKLLEFAASLPANYKVRWFETKYVMKRALRGLVPDKILKRRKVGFPVPDETWLRGELKPWLCELLLDPATLSRGYFNRGCIERLISENVRTGSYPKEVFSLATLELWHRAFLKQPCLTTE